MGASSIDQLQSRNNTFVVLSFNGQRVGRIQQFRAEQSNNVQVLAELGREFMVEMQKGITAYTFSVSSFYVRSDVIDRLKTGAVFSLGVSDQSDAAGQILEYFPKCMIQSLSRSYTTGQAAIGQDASIVTIGKGLQIPELGT